MLEMFQKNLDVAKGPSDENAMLTKRRLGPTNCASCDKNIINLSAMQPNPYNWKKLPQRVEPDRYA